MRKVGYLISMVGLLLVFTVKIGQAHRGAVRRRRVQRIWAHKRDEWLQNLSRLSKAPCACAAPFSSRPAARLVINRSASPPATPREKRNQWSRQRIKMRLGFRFPEVRNRRTRWPNGK